MTAPATIRAAAASELAEVNAVVTAAVLGWNLPERVKRLALPGCLYYAHDLDHIELLVAERAGAIVGVAACEPAEARERPNTLLLHGLYVQPVAQRQGIGRRLLAAAIARAGARGFDGLLVRAQAGAEGFFEKQGLERLAVADPQRDYQRRYWAAAK